MKGPALVKRRPGVCLRFAAARDRVRMNTGGPWLPPHWRPKTDADAIARIRAELALEERLAMLNVRFRNTW